VDHGGDEHWQLGLIERPAASRGSPNLTPLTDSPKVIHLPGRWRGDGRRFLFASNARDPRFFDIHELAVDEPSHSRLLYQGDGTHAVRAVLGDQVLVLRSNTNLDVDLLLLDGERTVHLNPHEGEVSVLSATLRPDGVYAAANPGREFAALVRYRPGSQHHEFVQEYPGDVEIVEASPVGDLLALVVNRDGWSETHLFDPTTREDRIVNSGPRGVISSLSWYPDGAAFAYDVSSVAGVDLYRRTVATGKERRLTGSAGAVPATTPLPRLGRATASDGVAVPYWEYQPEPGPARGTILHVHGGPEAQARPGFGPFLGFLIQEGWRIVAPNVRGSTGYGRTFTHLDDVRLRLDSVRDLAEVAQALVRLGKAVPGKIGVIGGSYGGFMVLSVTSTYPDLWGAAVDIVGIANLVTFLERTGPWRRALREAEYGSLETDRAFLEEISPIHRAAQIRAPLLVLHGRNDSRVPVHEAEQISDTLNKLGRPVELMVFENEGHGLVRRENQLTAWTRVAAFFAEHLDARPGAR
jgi:dipeptidyl aminopeptidase/acylaminoacyl peptidase